MFEVGWRRWLRSVWRSIKAGHKPGEERARLPRHLRLLVEVLEDRVTPSVFIDLASFTGSNGSSPYAGVVEDGSGNLFGTTEVGGSGYGTVFEWVKSAGTLSVLASFSGGNGANPYAGLVEDTSGNLFGTTAYGGSGFNGLPSSGAGTIFEWVQSAGTLSVLASFTGSNGEEPKAGLVQDTSGNLFGSRPWS